MIRLAGLTVPDARSWDDARRRFAWPAVDVYNIAADCLGGRPDATALLSAEPDGIHRISFGELDDRTGRLASGLTAMCRQRPARTHACPARPDDGRRGWDDEGVLHNDR